MPASGVEGTLWPLRTAIPHRLYTNTDLDRSCYCKLKIAPPEIVRKKGYRRSSVQFLFL